MEEDNINPLEPSGYYMYHLLYHTKTRQSAHTLHLRVPYESHNKQLLFPQTALAGWALKRRFNGFPVRYELNSYIIWNAFSLQRVKIIFMKWGVRLSDG
jgi:hypothetical protein